jgi:hypothetical protein
MTLHSVTEHLPDAGNVDGVGAKANVGLIWPFKMQGRIDRRAGLAIASSEQ